MNSFKLLLGEGFWISSFLKLHLRINGMIDTTLELTKSIMSFLVRICKSISLYYMSFFQTS